MENTEYIIMMACVYTLNKHCELGNVWRIEDFVLRDRYGRKTFITHNEGCIRELCNQYYCYNCNMVLRKYKKKLNRLRMHGHVSY